MKNYTLSKLYLITCLITQLKYIGATTLPDINDRLLQHLYFYRWCFFTVKYLYSKSIGFMGCFSFYRWSVKDKQRRKQIEIDKHGKVPDWWED